MKKKTEKLAKEIIKDYSQTFTDLGEYDKGEQKEFTFSNLLEARNEEKLKHYTILNYILNKNSHSISEGGVDQDKLLDDLQDYEDYLVNDL